MLAMHHLIFNFSLLMPTRIAKNIIHQNPSRWHSDEYQIAHNNVMYIAQKVNEIEQESAKYSVDDFRELQKALFAERVRESMGLDDDTHVRPYKELKRNSFARAKKIAMKNHEKEKISTLKGLREYEIRTREILNLVDMQLRIKIMSTCQPEQDNFTDLHRQLKGLKKRLDMFPYNTLDNNKLNMIKKLFKMK